MFYFFQRGTDFIRAEVNGDDADGYTITVTNPDGTEKTEQFTTSEQVHARWLELQDEFQRAGWWGPSGRD